MFLSKNDHHYLRNQLQRCEIYIVYNNIVIVAVWFDIIEYIAKQKHTQWAHKYTWCRLDYCTSTFRVHAFTAWFNLLKYIRIPPKFKISGQKWPHTTFMSFIFISSDIVNITWRVMFFSNNFPWLQMWYWFDEQFNKQEVNIKWLKF